MAFNRRTEVKDGKIGGAIRTPLIQGNGVPVDFVINSGWTFQIIVTARGAVTHLINQPMIIDPDQVNYPNYVRYLMRAVDFTALKSTIIGTTLESLKKVEFDLEIIATKPNGDKEMFPSDESEVFGTLVLLDSKAA